MFDALIIGSGLGGLTVAAALSKEGMNVCVVEKEAQIGGCLRCYRREGVAIDTGIHYVGSMDDGEILNQYFRYLGIFDKLRIQRLDEEAFDVIRFQGTDYPFAMGAELFTERLSTYFPNEKEAIRHYVDLLEKVGRTVGVEQLQQGRISSGEMDSFYESAWGKICSVTHDKKLQQVLAGNAILYGGHPDRSSFYLHAMVNDSYLHGAYRFINGSQQLADALVEVIQSNGGLIRTSSQVEKLEVKDGVIASVRLSNGETIAAKRVISSIHPSVLFDMIGETPLLRKALRTRIDNLSNSYGLFSAVFIQKEKDSAYLNHNIILHKGNDVWHTALYPDDTSINQCMVSMQPQSDTEEPNHVICMISPMYFSEVERWKETSVGKRGERYTQFKQEKADELKGFVEREFPGLTEGARLVDCATPLTYRDYTGTPEGAAYGIVKDYHNPLVSIIPVQTRIDNLFLVGQNVNLHGALGVTLTSMLACSDILGKEYLAHKISEA